MGITIIAIESGASVALMALAFQLIYLPTRVFFLSLALVYALAPYVLASLAAAVGAVPALVLAPIVCAALALCADWSLHQRLANQSRDPTLHLIISIGAIIFGQAVLAYIWGADAKVFGTDVTNLLAPADSVEGRQLFFTLVYLALIGMCCIAIYGTRLSIVYRASETDPERNVLMGFNIPLLRMCAVSWAAIAVSAVSVFQASDSGYEPFGGFQALLLPIVAVLLVGASSFLRPLLIGFVLGSSVVVVAWIVDDRWGAIIVFAAVLVVMAFRRDSAVRRTVAR